ncbi:MAG: DUF2442 domain-containing protein [Mangrovibacterium sp.]|nr:DUF2442 domain-containing protein [Mangrovibacterium sp.]
MNTSMGNRDRFDPIDKMIFEGGLRIQKLFFDKELDLMLIVLNSKKVIKESISKFKLLKDASDAELEEYEISRTGVHWPSLDEDLSLRGFLKTAMLSSFQKESEVA